ncbi:DUF2149 domain-containing protein [Niabella sp. CC-SYL272]|uniref:DUF2149 domain-containing protein n=1 Tax=Niabella agricola TaxID=2891571 RepID=UPI001F2B4E1B|nr:DUF2149 domain-containing protein [Niabella agricola]MCF3108102.1 DUF2149 domain-containing protein [Niabella agricola]
MKFLNSRSPAEDDLHEEDPMNGVAQLFDVSIAFIVAVIAALFTLLSSKDLLKADSSWELVQKSAAGEAQIHNKDKAANPVSRKATNKQQTGNGKRLGTAYELDNGEVIYVPDK